MNEIEKADRIGYEPNFIDQKIFAKVGKSVANDKFEIKNDHL